ncbi:MAG: mechanosensitive ion channel family protein [Candidatus Peribacteraceae bacterium]
MDFIFAFIEPYLGGNTLQDLYVALGIFVGALIVLWVLKTQVLSRWARYAATTHWTIDTLIVDALQGIGSSFYVFVSVYAAVQNLVLPVLVTRVIEGIALFVVVYHIIRIMSALVLYFLQRQMGRGKEEKNVSSVITLFVNITLWSVGLVLVLSNLGFDVTSLLAGLGVGGIAISLALQNVLRDIFSSFSIVIDKPFKEGDFIIVGDHMGVVKKIGLKTTRIEALQGEEIIISNNELTTVRIQNFKQMHKRRIPFTLGVTYDTPVSKLKKIPGMVKKIIKAQDHTEFDRAHFKSFGDFSLNFEFVYYVDTNEYNMYMDIQQAINLGIAEAFAKEKIAFAFPTQTVHVVQPA